MMHLCSLWSSHLFYFLFFLLRMFVHFYFYLLTRMVQRSIETLGIIRNHYKVAKSNIVRHVFFLGNYYPQTVNPGKISAQSVTTYFWAQNEAKKRNFLLQIFCHFNLTQVEILQRFFNGLFWFTEISLVCGTKQLFLDCENILSVISYPHKWTKSKWRI